MIYSSFAQVYDTLMDDSLYLRWRDYVQKRVPAHGQKLLELAGGSGSLALLLQDAGYDVALFDLSSEMLDLAEAKLVDQNKQMLLMQGDMRELDGIEPVSVVTCFDDSLCYMPDLENVRKVFASVMGCLKLVGTLCLMRIPCIKSMMSFPVTCITIKLKTMRSCGVVMLATCHIPSNMI